MVEFPFVPHSAARGAARGAVAQAAGEVLSSYKPKTAVGEFVQQALTPTVREQKSQLEVLIGPELVLVDVEASTPEALFAQLANPLEAAGCIQEGWLDAIVAREQAFPTGLDFGHVAVAIPHTDCEFVARPYVCVVRPARPIEFAQMGQSDENISAELVFNLGITQKESQVGVLQEVIGLCMDAAAAQELLAASGADELYQVLVSRVAHLG